MSPAGVDHPFDQIRTKVLGESNPKDRIEALIVGLAETIRTTSNDQNVQRLARDLRAAASELAESTARA